MHTVFRWFVASMLFIPVLYGRNKILDLDFDHGFSDGEIRGIGKFDSGNWKTAGSRFEIVSSPACSSPRALKIMRDGLSGFFAVKPVDAIPQGHDYRVDFDVYIPVGAINVIFFQAADGLMGGVITAAGAELRAYNQAVAWENCGKNIIVPANTWIKIRVDFFANQHYYRVAMITPDGKILQGNTEYPMLKKSVLQDIRFINVLPQKSFTYVDNIKIFCDKKISMTGRKDLADHVICADKAFAGTVDGSKPVNVRNGQTAALEFSSPVDISSLVLSGKTLPEKISVTVLNSLGHEKTIADRVDVKSGELLNFDVSHMISRMRITFHGNGRIEKLQILSPITPAQAELNKRWSEQLDAEYDLAVYDAQYPGCDQAVLTFVNHNAKALQVKLVLRDRLNGFDGGTYTYSAPPGRSDFKIDLKDIADGEYLTEIIDNSVTNGGRIVRLLRKRTSHKCTAAVPAEMDGLKIFFPDDHFLESHRNIRFISGTAEVFPAVKGSTDNDSWVVWGDNIGMDKDGRLVMNYHTLNRLWQRASVKHYHAVADLDDLNNWKSGKGYKPMDKNDPFDSAVPPEAKPDWEKKKDSAGKITYRFYDPAKDGKICLAQLRCEFINPAAPGTSGYADYDWGVMRPEANHIWTVWYKSPGEALIVGKKPLLTGIPIPGVIESPDSGSDLHFGQFLSDDGKTLFFGFGRQLIRFAPYQAVYDNAPDRNRIVGILRTVDGINWEQNFVGVPDRSKPLADQHYGGTNFRVPGGNGLRVAFLNRYSAYNQQINQEIIYSWDGFNWRRFQDCRAFVEPGTFDSWYRGGIFMGHSAYEHQGKIYHLINRAGNSFHFQSEVNHSRTIGVDHITGEYMKKMFSARGLDKWPFFNREFGGSWDKLAADTRNGTGSAGVLVYRADGFFCASAGNDTAWMMTKSFRASGTMKMNAAIREGGFIEIALLDDNGDTIDNFFRRIDNGDQVDFHIFDHLPDSKFRVKLTLKNADIYSLIF